MYTFFSPFLNWFVSLRILSFYHPIFLFKLKKYFPVIYWHLKTKTSNKGCLLLSILHTFFSIRQLEQSEWCYSYWTITIWVWENETMFPYLQKNNPLFMIISQWIFRDFSISFWQIIRFTSLKMCWILFKNNFTYFKFFEIFPFWLANVFNKMVWEFAKIKTQYLQIGK